MSIRTRLLLPGLLLFAAVGMMWHRPVLAALPRTNPSAYSGAQWAEAFTRANPLPLPRRIALWSDLLAVDAVYVFGPLGEGPGKLPVPGPLHDFRHVDCLTYLEQVYALALSRSYAQFPAVLQHIRYKDGQIDVSLAQSLYRGRLVAGQCLVHARYHRECRRRADPHHDERPFRAARFLRARDSRNTAISRMSSVPRLYSAP